MLGLLLFLREALRAGNALTESFYFPNAFFLVIAALLSSFAYLFQILCWNMIMQYLGIPLSLRQSIQGYPITFLPRYIPGSIWGYWSRNEWLKEHYGISYTESSLASALEVGLLVLTAILLSAGGTLFHSSGPEVLTTGLIFGGALILIWLGIPLLRSGMKRTFLNLKYWYGASALSTILLCLHGGTLYLVSLAASPTASLDLVGAIYATSLSWLLGFVCIFVPAGIGVREMALSSLLVARFSFLSGTASLIAVSFRFLLILSETEWIIIALILSGQKGWKRV